MDTPICVFDAETFVDHIHEIKAWFYGGHLRLVVPLSTSEIVEQLYKKSIEPKPATQETPRPKSASKAARKVHPAFDINPAVAKEFLARLRKGKEEEQDDKEKSSYYEGERRGAIQFQTTKEGYTPWKDIPAEEPKLETPDDRPVSWAELAKKKLQADGATEKGQGLKSSPKPKLVSKASGHDPSPWKMQNNLPKISATEVPAQLRPLMSCALWHLHESINRNDLNQLFLLTDQDEIGVIAKKLNIAVRSPIELGQKITNSIEKPDLGTTGMLEKEGLVKPKEEAKPSLRGGLCGEDVSENSSHVLLANPELQQDENQVKRNGHANDGTGSLICEVSTPQVGPSNGHIGPEKPVEASQDDKQPRDSVKDITKVAIDPRELVQNILNIPALHAQTRHIVPEKKVEGSTPPQPAAQNGQEVIQTNLDQKKPGQAKSEQPLPVEQKAKSPDRSANPPLSTAQDDPEDSDEEVVVFVPNPKRMSAQKRAAASSSRPTTSHGHPVVVPNTGSPQLEISKDPVIHRLPENGASKTQAAPHSRQRPRSSGPGLYDPEQGSTKVKTVSHGHPRPLSSGPTVIDPNAFGRGLPIPTTPGFLANVGTSRRSRQHSPRTSVQDPNLNANRSAQSSPQASPPRHKAGRSPRRSPRRGPRNTPQKVEDSPPTAVPVISHQAFTRAPLVAPNTQNAQKSRFGPIEPPSKPPSNLESSPKVADLDTNGNQHIRQPPIQRPKSANGPSNGHGHGHGSNSPRNSLRSQPNGSAIPALGGQQSQRTIKKSLFEPDLDHTGAQRTAEPEPKGIKMPEVQYTLKSGMTREAARGKGKLWVG